eukprot:s31_g17.t1
MAKGLLASLIKASEAGQVREAQEIFEKLRGDVKIAVAQSWATATLRETVPVEFGAESLCHGKGLAKCRGACRS